MVIFQVIPGHEIGAEIVEAGKNVTVKMQSHSGEISILPALPAKYPEGHVTGLCARGGHEVDICWKDLRPVKVLIRSEPGKKVAVR